MNNVINVITYPIKLLCIFLVYLYKILISPLLPKSCRYTPTCSTYCIIAIKRFGIFRGIFYSFKRILSCNSHSSKPHLDPVKDNIKGDIKWLI